MIQYRIRRERNIQVAAGGDVAARSGRKSPRWIELRTPIPLAWRSSSIDAGDAFIAIPTTSVPSPYLLVNQQRVLSHHSGIDCDLQTRIDHSHRSHNGETTVVQERSAEQWVEASPVASLSDQQLRCILTERSGHSKRSQVAT